MAGQDNLHIAREIFAAWNAHDMEGFVKRLDAKTTWESDAFPAPFSGHEGARKFVPPATVTWWSAGVLAEPTSARWPTFRRPDVR
jgi:hypothetical protein